MTEPALVFEGVRRSFGRTVALDGLDLTVEPGTVVGLVGRNGAGKSTTLRLAQGILHPDAGRIRVLGLDPVREGRQVRIRASLLSEESALYPWMTVAEILEFAGRLHPGWDPALADSFRERLGLDPARRVGTLSRGTCAKVALVLAVATRPEVLLLDDPTASLDPLARREVLEGIIEAVPEEGGAVLYASHLIHDVERVADRVVLMDGGRARLSGSLEDLKARVRRVRAVFDDDAPAAALLPGSIHAVIEGRVLTLVTDEAGEEVEAALRRLGARTVEGEVLSLEEILVAYLREGGKREEVASDA